MSSSGEPTERVDNDRRRILELLGLTPLAVLAPSVSEQLASASLQPDLVSSTSNTFAISTTPLPANGSVILGPLDSQKSDEVGVSVYANQPGTLNVETSLNNST